MPQGLVCSKGFLNIASATTQARADANETRLANRRGIPHQGKAPAQCARPGRTRRTKKHKSHGHDNELGAARAVADVGGSSAAWRRCLLEVYPASQDKLRELRKSWTFQTFWTASGGQ